MNTSQDGNITIYKNQIIYEKYILHRTLSAHKKVTYVFT